MSSPDAVVVRVLLPRHDIRHLLWTDRISIRKCQCTTAPPSLLSPLLPSQMALLRVATLIVALFSHHTQHHHPIIIVVIIISFPPISDVSGNCYSRNSPERNTSLALFECCCFRFLVPTFFLNLGRAAARR